MSHGLEEILRYFLLALLWLFFLYACRMVLVDVRRARVSVPDTIALRDPAGSSRRPAAHLRLIEPPDRAGQSFEVGDEVILGRSPACAIALERDSFASSVHARIFEREGELWVEDLGSRNGTFVNGRQLVNPLPLQRGDQVKIGTTVFEVSR
jgi:pSer/pThr/pTyr-binding forkhead associated (FHA) protein